MGKACAVRAGLLATAVVLVGWVRVVPLSLSQLDAQATRNARHDVAQRFAGDEPRVEQWIAQNPAQFARERDEWATRLKSELSYRGADQRDYVFLGDYDSYAWLRSARNYLRTGTTCDAVVDGECRDTYANAPVGRRDQYHRSLHIAAIVALHRLITRFAPDYPLPASAFLVPVIVGILGVFPAFAIGRRLGGDLAGWCAAVLIGVNPIFLQRSIGSDNDVWNLVLPLYMMWAGLAALSAGRLSRRLIDAVLAAVFAALHAATWRGWEFTYGVLVAALVGNACVLALRQVRRTGSPRVWRDADVRRAVSVLVVFTVASELLAILAGAEGSSFQVAIGMFTAALHGSGSVRASPAALAWPDVLRTVGELRQPNLAGIAQFMGGAMYFFVGWLGLLVLVLPRRGWQWWHFAVLIGGNYLYRYLLTAPDLSRSVLIALLALPLAVAVSVSALADDAAGESEQGAALAIVLWFVAALYLSFGGLRFVMLLVPPFAIACAVALGRLHGWLAARATAVDARAARWASPILVVLLAALLLQPIRYGYEAARSYEPRMNDAWWTTLEHIRDQTPRDAIVNTWWDYGYWVKYVADRRVSADGGSLRTHIPHWMGRALLAADEGESVGLLRMLDCGSDATPEPEGRLGAFGSLVASGSGEVAAHAMVVQLADRDRTAARALLTASGVPATAAGEVLAASQCSPSPAYLVLSTAMIEQRAWHDLGSWDPALPDTRPAGSGYVTPQWRRCQAPDPEGQMLCPIGAVIGPAGTRLESVVFVPQRPEASGLRLRAHGKPVSEEFSGTPGLLLLAGDAGIESRWLASPTFPNLGVLVDLAGERVLVGPPDLLRSTFTQLMYLDGRYAHHFEKFADRTGFGGERVVAWRINWDANRSPQPMPPSPAAMPSTQRSAD